MKAKTVCMVLFFMSLACYIAAYLTPYAAEAAAVLLLGFVAVQIWYYVRQSGGWRGAVYPFTGAPQGQKILVSAMAGLEIINLVMVQNVERNTATAILLSGGVALLFAVAWTEHTNIFVDE